MATGGVGNLTVFLGLNAAQFNTGLQKAQVQALKFGQVVGESVRTGAVVAGSAITALAGAAVTAFALLSKQAEGVAAYQGFADQMGESAANVTKLKLAADLSGTSLDNVASSSVKLNTALAGNDEKAKKAAAGLAAIGLSAADIKNKAPVEQLQAISDKLIGFSDGAEKSAVAVALFGESGKEMVGVLKEMGEQGAQQIAMTDEQIAAADTYSKSIARNKSDLSTLAQIVAAESIPAIAAFTDAVTGSIKEVFGLSDGATALKGNTGIRDFAEGAAVALSGLLDVIYNVGNAFIAIGNSFRVVYNDLAVAGNFTKVVGNKLFGSDADYAASLDGLQGAVKSRNQILSNANNRYEALGQGLGLQGRVQHKFDAVRSNTAATPPAQPKPRINISALGAGVGKGGGKADDTLKRQLENDLKVLESARKQEQDVLADRNKMLELYNSENLISFRDYFSGKRDALAESVKEQSALYDQEIARLRQYQTQQAKSSEREAAQGKINDLLEKKIQLQRDAGMQGIDMAFKEARAYQDLQRTMQGVNASILELLGNSADAARVRFDTSNEDLKQKLAVNNDTSGLNALETLRKLTVAQADYNQYQDEASSITARLQIAEDRINVARNIGALGELGGLTKLSEARRAAVAQMEAMVAAQEAVAKASGSGKLVLQAEQARAALESLRAQSDLLAQKFDTIFSDSASSAFSDFITGAKTAKEAFNSFINDAISQVTRLVSNQLFTSLMGGGGGGSSFGTILSSLFGGGRAVGGNVSAGRFYEVNENGPELYQQGGRSYLMTGGKAGSIRPLATSAGGGRSNYSTTFVLPNRFDRQTQNQIAQENRRQLERSSRLTA